MPTLKHTFNDMPMKVIEKNRSTYKNYLGGNILLHFYNRGFKMHIMDKEINTTLINFAIFLCDKGLGYSKFI